MKLAQLHEGLGNATQYNSKIIKRLVNLGFKVTEKEKTAGALKTWLSGDISFKNIINGFKQSKAFDKIKRDEDDPETEIRGPGFKIYKQRDGIFVAVNAGPRADEYAAGLDV